MSILIGKKYRHLLEKALISNGFEAIWLPDNPHVDPRLAGHSDLSAIVLENNKIIVSEHLFAEKLLVNKLTNQGVSVIKCAKEQSSVYPNDVNLCACKVGNKIIHNRSYTDPEIIRNISAGFIQVNQGYANCMVLVINDHRIITADKGITKKAAEAGLEVLKINSGCVKLDGFDEGFIGGTGFRAGDVIYFTGDIKKHPNAADIIEFIESAGLKICCLTDLALFDIGGAVVLGA